MSRAERRSWRHQKRGGDWLTVAGLIVVIMVGSGMPWYAMGIFFSPLVEEFGWGRGAYSVATSVYLLFASLSAVVIGRLVDRWGSRRVMLISTVAMTLTWLLMSQMGRVAWPSTLWQLYIVYALLGVGGMALGGVPTSALIARWFSSKRGMAMGFSAVGGSLPGVILVPLSAPLIAGYGWRAVACVFGLLVFLSLPFTVWVLRDPPEERDSLSGRAEIEVTEAITGRQALRMVAFWLIGIACLLAQSGSAAVQLHAVPFMMDRGLTRAAASNTWGLLALAAVVGKIGLGWAADRSSARVVLSISLLLQATSVMIALALPSLSALRLFAVLFGLGMGGQNCTRALLVAEYFGTWAYGTIWGLVALLGLPGMVGAQPLAGYLYDITGSYHVPYVTFVVGWLVAIGALVLLGQPRRRRTEARETETGGSK